MPNSQETFVRVYDNSVPKSYCDQLIAEFQACPHVYAGMLQESDPHDDDFKVCDEIHVRAIYHLERNNPAELSKWKRIDKQLFTYLKGNLSAFIGEFPALSGQILKNEGFRFKRYPKGTGKFGEHIDMTPTTPTRVFSIILYLNDVREGGETEFPFQGVRVQPKAGRMMISPPFWTHPHRGLVPISNDKFIVNNFLTL